jgi:uncharacterized protein (DUF362 family)/Pyruvate/2-oxoacid:ferredoxin oxidoreductase delta subunit
MRPIGTIVFIRKAEYDYSTLKPLVFGIMNSSIGDKIHKSSRVVIKPNLLAPAPPEMAMTTHPLIIRAAAEYVLDRGAVPQISDSPAVGSFEKILKESGIRDALKGLNVKCREFKGSVLVDVGKPFEKIEVARDVINADIIINLPKLKTHTQMLLTLGVKNLFGCIVGMKKPEWHFRAGVDREMFAKLLVKICQAVKPTVTILDGILAMEGQGPGKRGTPKELGVLMGSSNTAAIDNIVCSMLGIMPDSLLTNKISAEQGMFNDNINIDGTLPEIMGLKLPEITPIVFGPAKFHGFFRKHLIQKPVSSDSLCRLCGECWKYCPALAITQGKKKIRFDYEKCIRCYCCIEVCPHGALSTHETITGKISRKVLRLK